MMVFAESHGGCQLAIRFQPQLTYPLHLWPTLTRLDSKSEREALFAAIIERGSVTKAAESLGMSRSMIYRYSRENKDFAREFLVARATAAEALYDECIEIADDNTLDPRARHVRIETRMRVAGKLIPRLADKPTQVTLNDNRTVIVSEEKRAQLQDRFKRLQLTGKPSAESKREQ